MNDSDEIELYPVTEVRTCMIRGEAENVILRIRSGSEARHYVLSLADLAGLAARLANDAKFLKN